jgi:hypothetical protein
LPFHRQAPRPAGRAPRERETLDTYLKRIRRKLGPGNKAELTRRAIEIGEAYETG